MNAIRLLVVSAVCLAIASCAGTPPAPVTGPQAALALPDRFAAAAADKTLRAGGNAVDAAVAAAFVLAVTYPEAGNIGGGGFMLLYFDKTPYFLDYRETAPAAATENMYVDESGQVIKDLSLVGHRAAGIPGTVAGLWAAHQRFGVLSWAELLAPAIQLAGDGFAVPALLEQRARDDGDKFVGRTNFHRYFGGLRAGEMFRQPDLAATLRRIAEQGRDGFYRGKTARLVRAEMTRGGGLIGMADLQGYHPVWREPLSASWRGYTVLAAPPPSSGGFAVIQLLKMKDALAAQFESLEHNSPQYLHLFAEMEKRVFADRAEYLGDPDFVDVPIEELIDDNYIARRAREVQPGAISMLAAARPGLESHNTTHFSIVDRAGNAVSNTYTLNTSFGSGVVVEGGGFLLNNEMDDFSAQPGAKNFFGVVGNAANAIAPGKRMLSSMSPTILLENDEIAMVVGTPGGSTIFTTVFQMIVNVLDFGMSPEQSAGATRCHHQLLPPELITCSPARPLPAATQDGLESMGYRVEPHGWEFGDVQLIHRDAGGYEAAADPRFRGAARVLND